ncbi:hypothetical protein E2C01_018878 [Portunus trituberculatus]|uniref:Uncharacterized protein n=1 Tax=Portunus trituberculatus TaxID=210409 RepID=A0A5B7DXP0_PORTR|nr:hypothetical protein [Portunus trituberculatus]
MVMVMVGDRDPAPSASRSWNVPRHELRRRRGERNVMVLVLHCLHIDRRRAASPRTQTHLFCDQIFHGVLQ